MTEPGPAMICPGTVYHRRYRPRSHEFTYPVSYLWLDPDRPDDVCRAHWAWSSTSPLAPVQFRTGDYGLHDTDDERRRRLVGLPLGDQARGLLRLDAGIDADGPVRLITQPRRYGWLFNPISVYLIWDSGRLAGCVLEVTNTPWKERHHYAVAFTGSEPVAHFDKVLHVSPFLDEDYHYRLQLSRDSELTVAIDVVDSSDSVVVGTLLRLQPQPVAADTLSLRKAGLPTHRTSFAIHHQALKLAAKRIPFVPHPRARV